MNKKIKGILTLVLALGICATSQAQNSIPAPVVHDIVKCAPKPAQLKFLTKALISDMTNQLQSLGYQGVKVRVTTRKMSAVESVSIPKTGENFGLSITMSKESDGKPKITYNTQVSPSALMCTYGYRFFFRVRYLNTDSRMVTVSYPSKDFNIDSQIIYSNNIK